MMGRRWTQIKNKRVIGVSSAFIGGQFAFFAA
jgi:hypothetical protein